MDSPHYSNGGRNAAQHSRHSRGSGNTSFSPHSHAPNSDVSHERYSSHSRHSYVHRHQFNSFCHSSSHTSITDSTDASTAVSSNSASIHPTSETNTQNTTTQSDYSTTSRSDTIDNKERRVRLADGNIRTEYMVWYCCQGSHMQLLINSEVCLWNNGDTICGHQFCEDCLTGWSS